MNTCIWKMSHDGYESIPHLSQFTYFGCISLLWCWHFQQGSHHCWPGIVSKSVRSIKIQRVPSLWQWWKLEEVGKIEAVELFIFIWPCSKSFLFLRNLNNKKNPVVVVVVFIFFFLCHEGNQKIMLGDIDHECLHLTFCKIHIFISHFLVFCFIHLLLTQ